MRCQTLCQRAPARRFPDVDQVEIQFGKSFRRQWIAVQLRRPKHGRKVGIRKIQGVYPGPTRKPVSDNQLSGDWIDERHERRSGKGHEEEGPFVVWIELERR